MQRMNSKEESDMYFLYKVGVYGHGVFWIGDDLDEGKRVAEHAASMDRDDYHEWEIYRFSEQTAFEGDAEHEMVFSTHKGKEPCSE